LKLSYLYHLSFSRFTKMLLSQLGRCAVCMETCRDLHVDHDHACCSGHRSCGVCVRGLVCKSCNGGLGMFRDNPESLRRAAEYLENWETPDLSRLETVEFLRRVS
jgi:hypothetical protein